MNPHNDTAFMINPQELQERARQDLTNGAITPGYAADAAVMLQMLNRALATEIVCWLRYTNHALVAKGVRAETVAEEFREHATEELAHAQRLAARIVQLGGDPDLSPTALATRSHAEYSRGQELSQMLRDNLIAERVAIEWYREAIRFVGQDDPTTRRMLEDILADEEEHADDLAGFLRPTPN
jgi:bacterioferritin